MANPDAIPRIRADRPEWTVWLGASLLAAATAAAYFNATHGPLLYDDQGSVADNPSIRHLATSLRPPSGGWPVSGRPVFNLSLALNYAVSGQQTWSYHVLSVAIHMAAGLALFGIIRRTLRAEPAAPQNSGLLAWAGAMLWTLHPLQTEAVTYLSQRSEALMGLFYFSALYAFIRSNRTTDRQAAWRCVSVLCCALGMATKEVMVTAPVLILLYDRVFVARRWMGVRQRLGYYLSLAATWLLLIALMVRGGSRGNTAGFGTSIAWWAYGITQFRGVAHYLRLCFWPHPLLFSYGMTLGGPLPEVIGDAVVVIGLALSSLIAAVRGSRIGFLGAWFFIILSPSSSIVPVSTELIAEHRAYLSLAGPVVLAVWTVDFLLRRAWARSPATARVLRAAAIAALGLGIVAGIGATAARNRAYASTLALWQDTVARSPDDAGARNNFGNALAESGRLNEAVTQFQAALRLVPGYDQPHYNLGNTLLKLGRPEEAIPHFRAALVVLPNDASFRYALGAALKKAGRRAEARLEFVQAAGGTAESPPVWYFLGNALVDEGLLPEAKRAYESALRLRPDYTDALVDHAEVLAQLGKIPEAIGEFETAVRLEPKAADVRNNLGGLLAESGHLPEAREQFEAALSLQPDNRQARDNLERVKAMLAAAAH